MRLTTEPMLMMLPPGADMFHRRLRGEEKSEHVTLNCL